MKHLQFDLFTICNDYWYALQLFCYVDLSSLLCLFLLPEKRRHVLQNEMPCICYRSTVYFWVNLFLMIEIYNCLHIRTTTSSNAEFSCALVMTWGIFEWLLSVLRCSYYQFPIHLTALFLPSFFGLANVHQCILDNVFYGFY